jgi:hypothetical protein
VLRLALVLFAVLAAPAQAATDEQRLAAHLHTASSALPASGCGDPRLEVHIHGDAAIRAIYGDDEVDGVNVGCEIWIRSGLDRENFHDTLFHEMAHRATGPDHGPRWKEALDRALRLDRRGRVGRTARLQRGRSGRAHLRRLWLLQHRNRREGHGHTQHRKPAH